MDSIKEKIKTMAMKLKIVFGYGIMITLFVGGLSFFGYLIALFIGGNIAILICDVIYKHIMPVIIKGSTIMVLFGLLTMYLSGEKALTPSKRNKSSKTEK